jgi:Sigma-70, region 4
VTTKTLCVAITGTFYVPGTTNVLYAEGDVVELPAKIATSLVKKDYAKHVRRDRAMARKKKIRRFRDPASQKRTLDLKKRVLVMRKRARPIKQIAEELGVSQSRISQITRSTEEEA